MQNFDRTVVSQYSNSTVLCQLISNLNTYIDPNYNMQNFYSLIWNIDTAENYGLDIWGRIVGVGRVLQVATEDFLGFSGDSGASGDSFNAGIFYSGQPATTNFTLTDETYRQLIFAKAAANITDGSIPAINQMLLNLFPNRGNCYVIDNGNMTMVYRFGFALEPFEVAIIENSGVMPTPCGVLATLVQG